MSASPVRPAVLASPAFEVHVLDLVERWGAVEGEVKQRIWLIVDASESALSVEPAVLVMAKSLISSLPGNLTIKLHFLGNPEAYPVERFLAMGAQWAVENRTRVSLITPIWRQIRDSPVTTVVIGSGLIFDIEDWAGTELFDRALFVSLGQSLIGSAKANELANPDVVGVLQSICDSLVSVEIEGPSFMPLYWDNSGYEVAVSGGVDRLTARKLRQFSTTCQYLTDPEGEARAVYLHESGRRFVSPLGPAIGIRGTGGRLTSEEEVIFRAALAHGDFACPLCGGGHSWDVVRCLRDNPILGTAVYPSLEKHGRGLFLLKDSGHAVTFEQPGSPVLRLSPDEIAIYTGGEAQRYQCGRKGWTRTGEPLLCYQSVAKGTYALVL